jgi:hypothetical protein
MRTLTLGLMAAMLAVAPLATSADAAPKDCDRSKVHGSKQYRYNSDGNPKGFGYNSSPNGQSGDCTLTGWRDSSNTPIFRCPGQ